MRRLAAACTILALAALPLRAQNLVSNGSFETPALSPSTAFQTILAGGTMGAWTVTSGSIDLIRAYWAPADGFQSVDLNGNAAGTISQTIMTTAGQTYNLRFSMAGNPDNNINKVMRVFWGSQDLGLFTFTQSGQTSSSMGWQSVLLANLVASGSSTTLTFQAVTNGATGMALDHVMVSVVPEPHSLLLLGTGLAGALMYVRMRRREKELARA